MKLPSLSHAPDACYESVNYDVGVKPEGGFDVSPWFGPKKAIKDKNPLANLPYIEDDGVVICQRCVRGANHHHEATNFHALSSSM